MLAGGLMMMQGPPEYPYYIDGNPYPSTPRMYDEVLTNETPTFVLSMEYYFSRVELKYLSTNGSSISIYAISDTEGVIANFSDVSVIERDGIAFERRNDNWNLVFSRQDQNVELTFEIIYWYPPPVVDILTVVMVPWFIYGSVLFILSSYYLIRIERECYLRKGRRFWKDNQKGGHIIAWMLLFLILLAPLVYGFVHRHIQPVTRWETQTQDCEYEVSSMSLGATIDIFEIAPQNQTYLHVTLNNFQFAGTAHFRIFTEDSTVLNMTVISSQDFGIDLDIGNETSHMMEIYLDVMQESIAFSVVSVRLVTTSDWNPLIPVGLAALSVIPAIVMLTRVKELLAIMNQIDDSQNSDESPMNQ